MSARPTLERLAVVALAVLVEPVAFGLPADWDPSPRLAWALLAVVLVGVAVDRYRLSQGMAEPDKGDEG